MFYISNGYYVSLSLNNEITSSGSFDILLLMLLHDNNATIGDPDVARVKSSLCTPEGVEVNVVFLLRGNVILTVPQVPESPYRYTLNVSDCIPKKKIQGEFVDSSRT